MKKTSLMKRLLMGSTGLGGGTLAIDGKAHSHGHHHHHHADGSCCDHDHTHDHDHQHEEETDTTNPQGGCC
jgi:hypothetical protein